MTRKDKLREKFLNHKSDHNWSLDEVAKLLELHGFTRRGENGSSHHNFKKDGFPLVFTIPSHGGEVKATYIRNLRKELTK